MATQLSQVRAREASQKILEAIGDHIQLQEAFDQLGDAGEHALGVTFMRIILECANRVKSEAHHHGR